MYYRCCRHARHAHDVADGAIRLLWANMYKTLHTHVAICIHETFHTHGDHVFVSGSTHIILKLHEQKVHGVRILARKLDDSPRERITNHARLKQRLRLVHEILA